MSTTTIKYLAYAHLPAHLQAVSKPDGELAEQSRASRRTGLRSAQASRSKGLRRANRARHAKGLTTTIPAPTFNVESSWQAGRICRQEQ